MIRNLIRERVVSPIAIARLRLDSSRERFDCPICGYSGVFENVAALTGTRQHSRCPRCKAGERHRLQWLVVQELQKQVDFGKLRVLHMAPEDFMRSHLQAVCASYLSADLNGKGVDRQEDLTNLSFPDNSFDLVYCSHVLEHIKDDLAAIGEVRRVLSPGGIAILPLPILSDVTIEYPEPNPHEHGHVRAPGRDYCGRFKLFFEDVQLISSLEFDARYQVFLYEDRSRYPTPSMPNRLPCDGLKHVDYVPICR